MDDNTIKIVYDIADGVPDTRYVFTKKSNVQYFDYGDHSCTVYDVFDKSRQRKHGNKSFRILKEYGQLFVGDTKLDPTGLEYAKCTKAIQMFDEQEMALVQELDYFIYDEKHLFAYRVDCAKKKNGNIWYKVTLNNKPEFAIVQHPDDTLYLNRSNANHTHAKNVKIDQNMLNALLYHAKSPIIYR
ncbi:MAG: hypothetical protein J6T57_03790 [Alphaproteobacteria bacterium]|nr:hypothetical protein [Alphaproteobacteria bacterium]